MRDRGGWRWSNVPIPEFFALFLLVSAVLEVVLPLGLLPSVWVVQAAGVAVVVGGVAWTAWAVATVGAMDVSKPGGVISTGPYARSRNPMYVGWALILGGLALGFNSVWMAAALPLALVLNHVFAVLREERQLAATFGDEYSRYRDRVRRYL